MKQYTRNKLKIVNDPVYGFLRIPSPFLFDLFEHPLFQRLRRIKQLGLTHYVFPGATHTRLQHALGAMHLMGQAIETLRAKGHTVTANEASGALSAILLHDLGHGPFSHTLENTFVKGLSHEDISLLFMEHINKELGGELSESIAIYTAQHPKRFLHQLVSSQLDMDRMDYLLRDSFFTGVSEGIIGADRIIKMLNLADDRLAVDVKGIYSIEKFLIARRLMYWQVYLHKTVVAVEEMLKRVIQRAAELSRRGEELFASPSLQFFLRHSINGRQEFLNTTDQQGNNALHHFALLDDFDVIASVKVWCTHPDKVLSTLSRGIIERKFLRLEIHPEPEQEARHKHEEMKRLIIRSMKIKEAEADYFVFSGELLNNAYLKDDDHQINILQTNGVVTDIAQASDVSNVAALSKTVRKYFLCYPKDLQ